MVLLKGSKANTSLVNHPNVFSKPSWSSTLYFGGKNGSCTSHADHHHEFFDIHCIAMLCIALRVKLFDTMNLLVSFYFDKSISVTGDSISEILAEGFSPHYIITTKQGQGYA